MAIADDLFFIHQRPYSIRRVNKKSGGTSRVVREMTGDDRNLFGLKACSRLNQPIPDPSREHPCHQSECSELCFTVPNPEPGASSASAAIVKRCGCRYGYKINTANSHSCMRDTAVRFFMLT